MFEGIPLATLSPLGVLLVVVLFILTGKLVPRSALNDERQDTERWRVAHEVSEKARAEQSEQMRELLAQTEANAAQGEMTLALLRSIMERKP